MKTKFIEDNKWKNTNSQYLFELQKFLDLVDNIENEELKKLIIYQMLKCDRCVTRLAENTFKKINNNKIESER